MTDYLDELRDALHAAAAREYSPGRIPSPRPARTRGLRSLLTRRRPAVLAGITLLAAAATVVLLLGATTTTQPAYALVQHPDGSVTVTVHNLRTALAPLNARLAALSIPERVIPITDACPRSRSNVAFVYVVERSQFPQLRWTFSPAQSRKYLAAGMWGYIGIGGSDRSQLLLAQGAMRPPLPSCFNSTLGQIATAPTP